MKALQGEIVEIIEMIMRLDRLKIFIETEG